MKSLEELKEIREKALNDINVSKGQFKYRVVVGMATCGIAAGAEPVMNALIEEINKRGLKNISVTQTGCVGYCRLEPIVDVIDCNGNKVSYVKMDPEKVAKVVSSHLADGQIVNEYTVEQYKNEASETNGSLEKDNDPTGKSILDLNFYKKQRRITLRNCGVINPENIEEYIAMDGYKALGKVLTEMTPDEVIDVIKASGLKGRGGAGFPAGLKWQVTRQSVSDKKYVVCNADEGDPGAFMDRSVLEGDPHSVIEAMAIAGYCIGSDEGLIYVRAEYPIAVKRLRMAINQAKEYGLLGNNILGTGFNFDITLRLGAGAYVCGEETALIASLEGKRGEPRPKPPFPADKGVFGKPTLLNNVETYANIAQIILNGAEWYSSIGAEKAKGTKVFAMGGKVVNTGLVEVPMGTTLREIIFDIGGGILDGKKFKAVQTGGPSGGCLPEEMLDLPVDFDSLGKAGSIMGSGAFIVMDETTCMVDIAKFFLEFTVDESCGKCAPCRLGTKKMLEILNKITDGKGTPDDIEKLEKLAVTLQNAAFCTLGKAAPNPVLSTLKYFRHEYDAHINEKRCPAGVCKSLTSYVINSSLCKGCGICKKDCPVGAISGEKKAPHEIDKEKCIKCGACIEKCPFKAISKNA